MCKLLRVDEEEEAARVEIKAADDGTRVGVTLEDVEGSPAMGAATEETIPDPDPEEDVAAGEADVTAAGDRENTRGLA